MSTKTTETEINETKTKSKEESDKKPAVKKTASTSKAATTRKKAATKKGTSKKADKPAGEVIAKEEAKAEEKPKTLAADKATADKEKKATKKEPAAKKPAKAAAKKTATKKTEAKETAKQTDAMEAEAKTEAEVTTKKAEPAKKTTAKKAAPKKAAKKAPKKEPEEVIAEPAEPKGPLKVLMVSPEAEPFISTGGLGQVAGALPKELTEQYDDIDIRVVIPLYSEVETRFRSIIKYIGNTSVQLAWRSEYCGVFETTVHNVTYYFVDNKHYFDREKCYGYYDDAERFSFFSKSVYYVMEIAGFYPDIIHANDWQTALVPVFLKTRYAGIFDNMRTVFTIHNMEYQGRYGMEILGDVFDLAEWEGSLVEFEKDVNLLKGAIVTCDQLTTVSPSYAQELQEDLGHGMQALIRENNYKLTGILNGIDTQAFNPADDAALKANYSVDDIAGKAVNKRELQSLFGMEQEPDKMVVSLISRLVPHKGIDLLTYIMEDMLRMDIQFVLLGSGDHQYELLFEELAGRHHGQMGVSIAYNPVIARKIYAGSDLILVPSRTEPCGLAQMIACRYGAIPVVRATGGLKDSIQDCRAGEGNGFLFTEYSAQILLDTIAQAQDLYANHKVDWSNLVKQAMSEDFSWKKSAEKYMEIYKRIS